MLSGKKVDPGLNIRSFRCYQLRMGRKVLDFLAFTGQPQGKVLSPFRDQGGSKLLNLILDVVADLDELG